MLKQFLSLGVVGTALFATGCASDNDGRPYSVTGNDRSAPTVVYGPHGNPTAIIPNRSANRPYSVTGENAPTQDRAPTARPSVPTYGPHGTPR